MYSSISRHTLYKLFKCVSRDTETVVAWHPNGKLKTYNTVEIKRGKYIQGSCKNLWSNKEHRAVNGLNIVSLTYIVTGKQHYAYYKVDMEYMGSRQMGQIQFFVNTTYRSCSELPGYL